MSPLMVPKDVIKRLFFYYRALLESRQKEFISSEELSKLTGNSAAQIRKDLTYFGQFGVPGRGYNIIELENQIKSILGIDKDWDVLLVGVGNLGNALLSYSGLSDHGFKITKLFDSDPNKIGKILAGVKIQDIGDIKREVQGSPVKMAIVTVPAVNAQGVINLLVEAGIKAILNFAPVKVFTPEGIRILNIDITNELARLSHYLTNDINAGQNDGDNSTPSYNGGNEIY